MSQDRKGSSKPRPLEVFLKKFDSNIVGFEPEAGATVGQVLSIVTCIDRMDEYYRDRIDSLTVRISELDTEIVRLKGQSKGGTIRDGVFPGRPRATG